MTVDILTADEVPHRLTRDLVTYVGGFSAPSKMPGRAYGLPAEDCITGTKLRAVTGSTCRYCYAYERGAYAWTKVKAAYKRRLAAIGKPFWAEAIAEVLNRRAHRTINGDVFRWHDSGDLQSVEHLAAIVKVCKLTPDVRHWLPTREYRIVTEYVQAHGPFPANLNVRLSAHMIGGHTPTFPRLKGLVTVSTVDTSPPAGSHDCPSRHQGNECGTCRACWSTGVPTVSYHLH